MRNGGWCIGWTHPAVAVGIQMSLLTSRVPQCLPVARDFSPNCRLPFHFSHEINRTLLEAAFGMQ